MNYFGLMIYNFHYVQLEYNGRQIIHLSSTHQTHKEERELPTHARK